MNKIKSPNPIRYITIFPSVVFIFLLILGTTGFTYGQWTEHIIDPNVENTGDIQIYDIDNDGDMDLFVTLEYESSILCYENNNNLSWTRHTVDDKAASVTTTGLADFDMDGRVDIVATLYGSDLIVLYRSGEGDPFYWYKDTIDNSYDGPTIGIPEDLDNDGDMDIVVKYRESGEMIWYENNLPLGWSSHLIGSDMKFQGAFWVSDINKDNKPDVVRCVANKTMVVLFINNLPDNNWTEIIVDNQISNPRSCSIGDIDNDGDMDIVANSRSAIGTNPDVVWYENNGSGLSWTKYPITSELNSANFLYLADINSNGYVDIAISDEGTDDVILLRNKDGGKNWTTFIVDDNYTSVFTLYAHDIDLDGDIDIIPARNAPGALIWYENPLGSVYTESLEASPFLIQSTGDTLTITAELNNPDNHVAHVFAVIQGDQSDFVDTLQLFDDGLHNDSLPTDQRWGTTRLPTGLPEDGFKVDIITYDSTTNESFGFLTPARFITFGPVEFAGYSNPSDYLCNKTTPEPGGCLNLKVTLKNNSSVATAKNVTAELVSLDTLISFMINSSDFQDIPAGESSESNKKYLLSISEEWQGKADIQFIVNISSYGNVCWRDTLSIMTNVNYFETPMFRIYPNPLIDLLTIETEQPGHISVEITSLNGQLIYSSTMKETSYQIDLSSFQKGVYFITIRSKNSVTTEKIIKL